MKVVIKLINDDGAETIIGEMDVSQDSDDIDEARRTAAAVAWNAVSRNSVFEVDGCPFEASECRDWWA